MLCPAASQNPKNQGIIRFPSTHRYYSLLPSSLVMGRALKNWSQANPEPWKSISSQAQPRPFTKVQSRALTSLCFLLHKSPKFQGPSQKIDPEPGPFSKFWARSPKKWTDLGSDPSLPSTTDVTPPRRGPTIPHASQETTNVKAIYHWSNTILLRPQDAQPYWTKIRK